MSPLEQHTAIALYLEYTFEDKQITYDGEPIKFRIWRRPDGGGMGRSWPPNYPECLNAMHEAEKMLTDAQWIVYISKLHNDVTIYPTRKAVSATAAQRAEALLRTIGKWVDE